MPSGLTVAWIHGHAVGPDPLRNYEKVLTAAPPLRRALHRPRTAMVFAADAGLCELFLECIRRRGGTLSRIVLELPASGRRRNAIGASDAQWPRASPTALSRHFLDSPAFEISLSDNVSIGPALSGVKACVIEALALEAKLQNERFEILR